MKKLLFVFSILLGLSMMLVSCYEEKNETRIRILSEDDQISSIKFKEEVKVETLNLLKKISYQNPTNVSKYLDQELKKKYPDQLIVVTLEDVCFPAKVLDGKLLPSGTYETILIKIGDGLGSNWWSILYPEFFGTTYESSSEVEYRSYFFDLFTKDE